MVDLIDNKLILGGTAHEIQSWQVWWQTPFGLYTERTEAIARLQQAGMDPELVLCPVPVAVGHNQFVYEVVARL